jgi:hypothetical protein
VEFVARDLEGTILRRFRDEHTCALARHGQSVRGKPRDRLSHHRSTDILGKRDFLLRG